MRIALLVIGLLGVLAAGCGSSEVAAVSTVEERFNRAKAMYDDKDYLEAINEFTIITLQFQGSAFAADAQYYLGECRFQRGEYLLASFEYSVLKRNYPASARVPDAQYKLALSYYELSPKSQLDPQYTKKAIDEFQQFVEYYPSNAKAADATEKIKELNTRLAKKQYETAKLYTTMEYYRAAMLSFDEVIEKYHDTEYAPLSFLAKTELLISRNRYQEAHTEIEKFLTRYPNSVLRSQADELKARIDKELASRKPAVEKKEAAQNAG